MNRLSGALKYVRLVGVSADVRRARCFRTRWRNRLFGCGITTFNWTYLNQHHHDRCSDDC